MWARLQRFKFQIAVGLALCFAHSLLCVALYKASLRNMELGALWEQMRLTDLPASLLLDKFVDANWNVVQETYHKSYFRFHLFVGGLQFFVWGLLFGALANRLRKRSRPAQTG